MVTVKTFHVYNIKTITRKIKIIQNTKDRLIGDFNTPEEKCINKYFKEQFKL